MANELHAHRGLYESLWESDPAEAQRELDRFNDLKDSLYNHASAESLAKYNAEFGNDWLQLENHAQRRAQLLAIVIGVVVACLLAVLAIAIWWVMRRRHRLQTAINQQLTSDIAELREKYNNLQIQDLQRIANLATCKKLQEATRAHVAAGWRIVLQLCGMFFSEALAV